jgi:hypothetical protein
MNGRRDEIEHAHVGGFGRELDSTEFAEVIRTDLQGHAIYENWCVKAGGL